MPVLVARIRKGIKAASPTARFQEHTGAFNLSPAFRYRSAVSAFLRPGSRKVREGVKKEGRGYTESLTLQSMPVFSLSHSE